MNSTSPWYMWKSPLNLYKMEERTIFLEQEGSPWHGVCMTKTMLTIFSAAEKYGDFKMSKTIFHGTVSRGTSIQEKKKGQQFTERCMTRFYRNVYSLRRIADLYVAYQCICYKFWEMILFLVFPSEIGKMLPIEI